MQDAAERRFTSYDALKLFALATMTLDHVGAFLLPHAMELRVIGRFAAPIFCFLVGWNGQYRFRRELLVAAALMSVLDLFYLTLFPLNILWTIVIGRALMAYLDRRAKPESPVMMITMLLLWLASFALTEYGTLALLWMLWGRAAHKQAGSTESWIYAVASGVAGGIFMMALMPYTTPAQYFYTAAVFVVLVGGLQRFRVREYPALRAPILLFFSRHSMEYYVLHRAVIFVIGAVLGIIVPTIKFIS